MYEWVAPFGQTFCILSPPLCQPPKLLLNTNTVLIIIRPGRSQGLLYKNLRPALIK